jgi:hypothetical protein
MGSREPETEGQMPDSDITSGDTKSGDTKSGDTKSGDTTGEGRRGRPTGGPQPLTVFTGSHGLQGDKPRAGEDAGRPDDTSTESADPDSPPDVRR